ncbi:MAG: hypothetical protein HC938_11635 [Nitrospira sp.]|nr:hypothetical protein [Nitrospira sp.]
MNSSSAAATGEGHDRILGARREVLGDLRTSTIKDIWNGPAYRKVRRAAPRPRGAARCRSLPRAAA